MEELQTVDIWNINIHIILQNNQNMSEVKMMWFYSIFKM